MHERLSKRALFLPASMENALHSWIPAPLPYPPKLIATYAPPRAVNVLCIFRKGYVSHPRIGQRAVKPPRVISNEAEVLAALRNLTPLQLIQENSEPVACSVNVRGVYFEDLSMAEQVLAVRAADIVIGMHGAALSYAVLMRQHTLLVELTSSSYAARYHFDYFSTWSGVTYRAIHLAPTVTEEFRVSLPELIQAVQPFLCKVLYDRPLSQLLH